MIHPAEEITLIMNPKATKAKIKKAIEHFNKISDLVHNRTNKDTDINNINPKFDLTGFE